MGIMPSDLLLSSIPTASVHLTLFSGSSGSSLCGASRQGRELDVGYTDLSDAATRDCVCRACLREWLRSFTGDARPSWARELGGEG